MAVDFISLRPTLPSTPGVYFFRGERGKVLYVGKAVNIRQRLASYFTKSTNLTPAKKEMLERARTITWQDADSEIDALLQEASYIKKHRPPYNIVLRDDKYYSFVEITKEQFPRIFIVHRPTLSVTDQKKSSSLKSEFIGPFTNGYGLKNILRSLRKIFPYCTCKQYHTRRCQQAQLGLCAGICCLKNYTPPGKELAAYQKNIRYIRNVLFGRQKQLMKTLERTMQTASAQKRFEDAAHARDQLRRLSRIFAHSRVIKKEYGVQNQKGLYELRMLLKREETPERIEGYDISNIQGAFAVGSLVVFTDGMPDKNEYRKFRIKTVEGANDPAMMNEVLTRRFAHTEWTIPDVILIDGGRAQLHAAVAAYKTSPLFTRSNLITIISIAKREEELYIPGQKMPIPLKKVPTSLLYLLQQIRNESHRFAISYYRKRHRRELL
ncbi:MAG: hypothetical protein COU90_00070 [Candidatus Ryanbacteria bacterium CG10_big_fil_rev_8_21_14_0_10_43_42]|uniref:Excinuclease ABC subunit C n=1 Tax=Candidatus Ryanbacteria bacterium CG10_big_fil_rev_8_21_14_0_10_43_42 TaxID=1974864 RepID=A0A2M8KYE2_9BACT|nr:MAG: hypothetical protein COU90_00070 [Candidatus Ryanbacteria bacterium CG10_big_fil_rev_8_21_14_0_10_43_42]